MRKSLLLAGVLFVLSGFLLCGAYGGLDSKKDAVTIGETVLAGHAAEAKGISLTSRYHYDHHLFWDTVITPGGQPAAATDFRFYQQSKWENSPRPPRVDLSFSSSFSLSGNTIDLEDEYLLQTGVAAPVRDVAGRTPAGQRRREIILLKDYYDVYPLFIDAYTPGLIFRMDDENRGGSLEKNFCIPVRPDHRLEISVVRDRAGNITEVESNTLSGGIGFESNSVILKDAWYLALSLTDLDTGGPLPVPAESSGIHLLPIEEKDGKTYLSSDRIQLVYPLDETTRVCSLQAEAASSRLLLVTEEPSGENATAFYLSVIDRSDMRLIQKTQFPLQLPDPPETKKSDDKTVQLPASLPDTAEAPAQATQAKGTAPAELKTAYPHISDVQIVQFKQCDGFLAAIFSDGSFYVLTPDAGGLYELQMCGDLYECGDLEKDIPLYDLIMSYDGRRLAVACYQNYHSSLSTCLLVYRREETQKPDSRNGCHPQTAADTHAGLVYAAVYDFSNDRTVPGVSGYLSPVDGDRLILDM
ncbi:hypothetical protein [Bacilliculturomica massiliensis]|uniref:hypothetical protein n=1 Tax=Bacilliculturomica massiliensis TaxID=1917867 RepID=UPI00102F68B1|nr:hypothetical protein [Bacilliculturomica massiliensis]